MKSLRARPVLVAAISLSATVALITAGTGSSSTAKPMRSSTPAATLKIGEYVTGVLGQRNYFDSAHKALLRIEKKYHAKVTSVQGGVNNPTAWEQGLDQLSNTGQDAIVFPPVDDPDGLSAVVKKHLNQKYIVYDVPINTNNVESVIYYGAEGGYLAGVLAGYVTTHRSQFKLATGTLKLGFMTGLKLPVTEDFRIGFTQGARSVNPKIQVKSVDIGSFDDQTKAYNLAAAMYNSGVDVIYTEAGAAQVGVAKAAKDKNKYVIGGTVNVNDLQPGHSIASDVKDVEGSVYNLLVDLAKGKFKGNKVVAYRTGKPGGMRLIVDPKHVPANVRAKIAAAAAKINSGKIKVKSATGQVSHP